jgi:protein-S-isoprenylcysteine O-methyltransferase Ste14
MNKTLLGILLLILYFAVSATIYFACAGRIDLPIAWLYFALNIVLGVYFSIVIARSCPDLIAERLKPGPGEQDRVFKAGSTLITIVMLVLAGLDVGRYHWMTPVSLPIQIAGLIIGLSGYIFTTWAVVTNRFFSSAVRLQPDRQQVVIDTGPYAYVRHPGYTGAIPYMVLGNLALGSWLSTIVGGIPLLIIIFRRILVEDAMLRTGLPGYAEYAARVKYRLIPGLW